MDTIQIKDKRFTTFIPEERILREVERVASEINRDFRRYESPVSKCAQRFVHVCSRFNA